MDLGLRGRVGWVTGASSGMGRAIAAELVREGARVAVSSSSTERIAEAADAVGAEHHLVLDAERLDAVPEAVASVEAALGPVEVLVTNTGGPPPGPDPLGFSRDDWERAHRTLVEFPLALVSAVMPGMRERRWGRIVNVGSSTMREPNPALMLSNVERSGVLAGFKTIARAVAADGVTLNTALPGLVATARLTQNFGSLEAAAELAKERVPAARLGSPEEFAAVVAFLCSERASYVTGAAVLVDGGLTVST